MLRLPFNLGIGGAVQTGFKFAFERGYDIAVRVDGDGQHDPAQLGRILEPVLRGDADIAVGSRFAAGRAATGRRAPAASGSGSSPPSSRASSASASRTRRPASRR